SSFLNAFCIRIFIISGEDIHIKIGIYVYLINQVKNFGIYKFPRYYKLELYLEIYKYHNKD
uniref:hypothetical protein n=1 Tax=Clostridium sp. LS TaxID=1352601 RepID=UPI001A9A43DF